MGLVAPPPSLIPQDILGSLAGEISHIKSGGSADAVHQVVGGGALALGATESVALTLKLDELSLSMTRALAEVKTLSGAGPSVNGCSMAVRGSVDYSCVIK